MMNASTTGTLVSRCLGEVPASVDTEAMARARQCLVDGIAVAVAARDHEGVSILKTVALAEAAHGPAGIIGSAQDAGAETAALVNGMMVSVLLFDDNHMSMRGHPTAPILPVVLALGEESDASLEAALRAFVVGYEMESWLGLWFNPSQYEIGWHATATQGTLGAAIAASLMLGLSEEKATMALGIAASMVGGLRANFGTMTMSYHSGLAASAGIRAARLAQRGFTANPDVLGDKLSLGEALSREWDGEAFAAAAASIGEPLQIVDPGPVFKIYPCGRPTLPAVDCMMELRRQGLRADDVASMRCEVSFMYPRTLIHPRPTTGLQAKTSLEYCIASALVDDGPRLWSFTDEAVMRPEVRSLIERIEVVVPPELSEDNPDVRRRPFDQPVTLTVTRQSGEVVRARVRDHKGMPDNPASAADLRHKFISCAEHMLGEAGVDRVLSYINDGNASVRGLRALMRAEAS